jgi:hypothetical protein
MLLILIAMIIGSSLAAFSSPIGSSASAGLSGLRLAPQKLGGDAPFAAQNALPSPNADPAKPSQRGSLINLSV